MSKDNKHLTEEERIQKEVERILRAEKIVQAWSPDSLRSRPSEAQLAPILALTGPEKYIYCYGGNQSFSKGNLVSMADGSSKDITDIVVGDLVKVLDFTTGEITSAPVVKVWNNGIKPVYRWHFKHTYLDSTEKHEIVQFNDDEDGFYKAWLNNVDNSIMPERKHGVFIQPRVGAPEFLGDLEVFDLTVDHPDHNYICNEIAVGNSGKTNGVVRALVWMLEESSPYWRRPTDNICNNKLCNTPGTKRSLTDVVEDYECPKCGNVWRVWDANEPLNIMLCGEQLKNIDLNIYQPRIKKLFQNPDEWREDKLGSPYIQCVTNLRNGNRLIAFPHSHGDEKARKAVQGYTIHAVFADEQMSASIIEELQRRVDARMGTFMAAFTMKDFDDELVEFIDAQVEAGAAKKFMLSKLDNPVYAGSKDIIMRQLAGLSEAKRNTILYGIVEYSSEYIFSQVKKEEIGKPLPKHYSPKGWRHVEVIDPAIKTKAGRMVFAQDPLTKIWHVVHAQVLSGMLNDRHLYEAHLKLKAKEGYIPVLSIADDDAGFIGAAAHHENPTKFVFPKGKRAKTGNGGKLYLIKQAVGLLLEGVLHIDPVHELIWKELRSYRWKDSSNSEVVNSHKYHLIDCIQYFLDAIPDEDKQPQSKKTWEQRVIEHNMYPQKQKRQLQKRKVALIMGNSRAARNIMK